MNRTEHLLTCLAEECAEVAQRCTKALRFGLGEIHPGKDRTNAERLVDEILDLYAVVGMLEDAGAVEDLNPAVVFAKVAEKKARKERFLEYSRSQGTLRDDPPGPPGVRS